MRESRQKQGRRNSRRRRRSGLFTRGEPRGHTVNRWKEITAAVADRQSCGYNLHGKKVLRKTNTYSLYFVGYIISNCSSTLQFHINDSLIELTKMCSIIVMYIISGYNMNYIGI